MNTGSLAGLHSFEELLTSPFDNFREATAGIANNFNEFKGVDVIGKDNEMTKGIKAVSDLVGN